MDLSFFFFFFFFFLAFRWNFPFWDRIEITLSIFRSFQTTPCVLCLFFCFSFCFLLHSHCCSLTFIPKTHSLPVSPTMSLAAFASLRCMRRAVSAVPAARRFASTYSFDVESVDDFKKRVLQADVPTLVDFTARFRFN